MSGLILTAIAVVVYILVVVAYGMRRVHETESRESRKVTGQAM